MPVFSWPNIHTFLTLFLDSTLNHPFSHFLPYFNTQIPLSKNEFFFFPTKNIFFSGRDVNKICIFFFFPSSLFSNFIFVSRSSSFKLLGCYYYYHGYYPSSNSTCLVQSFLLIFMHYHICTLNSYDSLGKGNDHVFTWVHA